MRRQLAFVHPDPDTERAWEAFVSEPSVKDKGTVQAVRSHDMMPRCGLDPGGVTTRTEDIGVCSTTSRHHVGLKIAENSTKPSYPQGKINPREGHKCSKDKPSIGRPKREPSTHQIPGTRRPR
jgi:hypothetical protein